MVQALSDHTKLDFTKIYYNVTIHYMVTYFLHNKLYIIVQENTLLLCNSVFPVFNTHMLKFPHDNSNLLPSNNSPME